MADMTITPVADREFEVQLRDPGGETNHRVSVPEDLIAELELPADDLEGFVRASFEFLLEREPASAIMSEFSLDVISRYFPEYRDELSRRFS
jgi:hypothetical protein